MHPKSFPFISIIVTPVKTTVPDMTRSNLAQEPGYVSKKLSHTFDNFQ